MASVYDIEALRRGLLPWRLHFVSRCGSTNDLAARMRREGRLFAPAVIVTPQQLNGRGRGSNIWRSDPGTLTVTFAVPVEDSHPPHHLPILAGLAVREAVVTLCEGRLPGGGVRLKWPNDVMLEGAGGEDGVVKKLAGLLCERVENVDLVGVGLNVSTDISAMAPEILARATSLELAGVRVSLTTALIAVARQLRLATEVREPFSAVLRRYDAHHLLVGRRVEVKVAEETTVSGTCTGLDAQGRLLLTIGPRTERIVSGVVTRW